MNKAIIFFNWHDKVAIIAAIVIFSACACHNQESWEIISVNPESVTSLHMSSVFSTLDTIPYPNDMVSAQKAIPYKDCLYLSAGNKILVLDKKREQQSIIDHRGKGYGEYLSIRDFSVSDNLLFINDGLTENILVYSLDGVFQYSFKHNLLSNTILVKNGKVYIDCGQLPNADNPYMVNVFDAKSGDLLNSFLKKKTSETYLSVLELTNFASVGEDVMYSSTFSPVIYRIYGDEFVPKWKIDFESKSLPEDFSDGYKDLKSFMDAIHDGGYATRIDGYHETESKMFFMYSIGDERPFVLYDKTTGTMLHFNRILDDMSSDEAHTFKTSYQISPLYIDDDVMYVMAGDENEDNVVILACHFKDSPIR